MRITPVGAEGSVANENAVARPRWILTKILKTSHTHCSDRALYPFRSISFSLDGVSLLFWPGPVVNVTKGVLPSEPAICKKMTIISAIAQ